ncbi:ABC transporter ATP-binding protein/permease [Rhizobium lemnae]|uniref:ABC transporter ATP-binding protein/permease n=1 Tax=Rhizobium lemnae TaxID=1214924 RepID=A0ABV8EH17_9HYPH|nr:ABC transporter ATP-binding protein/permease [Rhizobium lemnae]MCJ8508898.1 ABC transporter ATP-binding protein/permease [Rhizobium lemnae]
MASIETKTPQIDPDTGYPPFTFGCQLKMMAGAFWSSQVRNKVLLLIVGLLTIILTTVYAQYRLNYWNTPFYNALEQRDLDGFFEQLKVFFIIAGSLLVLNVIQAWLNQMTALFMREGLTRDLVDQWMHPRRALRLASLGKIGVNPDQRLHEDARNLAELTTTLAIGLVNATILLASFIGVLWVLSADFAFTFNGQQIAIPGYMVWAALLYAGSASMLSNYVGRRLPTLNTQRYSQEAELRFTMMRTNENMLAITLTNGEDSERRRIQQAISEVLAIIRRLAFAYTNLTWVSAGFGWLTTIAPILIAAPVYFSGGLSFGGLMMAVGAFNQVNTALRWYIDNFRPIADWKAALYRVSVFRRALIDLDNEHAEPETLTVEQDEAEQLTLKDLLLSPRPNSPGGDRGLRLDGQYVILSGERIMVNGDPRANRRLLFQAIAGLWPWGKGTIRLPKSGSMLLVPQKGFFPDATLDEVLTYPMPSATYTPDAMGNALEAVGLGRLTEKLSARERWERVLQEDDQMRLRIANVLLVKPRWIVLDDAFEALETETQSELLAILDAMSEAAIIYVGRSETFLPISTRLIHLQPY